MRRINMKRWLSIVLSLVMVLAVAPGTAYADADRDEVPIDQTNFPDEVFRTYVSSEFDSDGNGSLSDAEIAQAKEIYMSFDDAANIKGVEYLTALEKLWAPEKLTELDLSKNTALTHLHISRFQMAEMDLSKNTALVELWCEMGQLTKLDVSRNAVLQELRCYANQLTELDVSNCTMLKHLDCSSNNLTSLDVSGMTALESLFCAENQLTELYASGCTAMHSLDCSRNVIKTVDLSGDSALVSFSCGGNQLASLDLSDCTMLGCLRAYINQLKELDVSNNTELRELYCFENQLTELDVSNNTKLEVLRCDHNSIGQLDITNCPELVNVFFNGDEDHTDYTWSYTIEGGYGTSRMLWFDKSTDLLIPGVERIAGKNRFLTAVDAADKLKAELGVELFPNIVIASGTDFPDALAGAYLAIEKDAPVLLTNAGFAPTVAEYAKDNLAEGGTVYILGGKGAVPEVMETELEKVGITNVQRLAGTNRYATNIQILREAGVTGRNLLICSGTGYADSLSASALGKPILLVGSSLTQEQKDFLAEVKEDMSGDFFVLGGSGAVSEAVFEEVSVYAKGTTERVSGKNRFETSVAIAKRFLPKNVSTVVLAYAMNYPDGLAGGPVAYANESPLLLITDSSYSAAANYVKAAGAERAIIMGGKALIPSTIVIPMIY